MQVSVLRLHMGPVETVLLWVVSILSIQLETQTFQPAQIGLLCILVLKAVFHFGSFFTRVPFGSTSVLTRVLDLVFDYFSGHEEQLHW